MRTGFIIAGVAAAAAIGFGIYMVDVDMTEEASLPEVDLSIEGGNVPEFDVQTGDIELGTEEVTMEVPKIEIETPEEDNRVADNQ
ncbi:hypothetical protein CEP88_02305 [Roseobacter denitrificans]|uniref:Uncharacterized protein n=1 Tax=Roseobacter denitrificans (strain ATCC 33942 / OCh 114) TaxID=375451 RepID=Q166Q3_ROSDO|nr:hypothetical protein [Roseobacter denitrificans]ABG32040.1 hypothetical protein-transmembra [Roseobacter denitrificans OCh 114]AVL51563.1 hypothetical protein CEP88_02305 [Roseobacter denitrificans]SFG36690.1 hypothetical protein SAMN05443635_114107 [Roseobacter denitrificans OCh 114]